jgi:hypothetical protein
MNAAHHPSGHHSTAAEAAQQRVALYTSGNKPSTLDSQEAALRRYLTTHQPQWRIVAVYRDVAPTGGWRAIRPGLRHVLHAATAGMFDLVLVHPPTDCPDASSTSSSSSNCWTPPRWPCAP